MHAIRAALLTAVVAMLSLATNATAACTPGQGIGLARIANIDTSTGPLFGDHTGYQRSSGFLGPKEVVLTFDDGPMPWITKSILDTLDRHCTKATFFSVGRMAIAYPATTREIMARGHTLGTHTWSHPLNLRRLKPEAAVDEMERGFAAVALAAGQPIAPFFRFPGLNDNAALLTHLQGRKVATFTVDVISNDSYIHDAARLIENTLAQVEARKGGIVLFHDIKAATARALPTILTELKARGYTVVHMRSTAGFEPSAGYDAQLAPILAKAQPSGKGQLIPFYAAAIRPDAATVASIPETAVSPEAKTFVARAKDDVVSKGAPKRPLVRTAAAKLTAGDVKSVARPVAPNARAAAAVGQPQRQRQPAQTSANSGWTMPFSSGWVTTVAPPAPPRLRRSAID